MFSRQPDANLSRVTDYAGLTTRDAQLRLARDGPNDLPQDAPRTIASIAVDAIRQPMFLLLLACVVIYVVIGDRRDAALLSPFVMVIVGITVFQEYRTERALAALRLLSVPTVRAIRDGAVHQVPARDLVVGDLILLNEGERIAADGELLAATNVMVDESLLTGESAPVSKFARPDVANADRVLLGTLLVRGHGYAKVIATGPNTELGRIGTALQSIHPPPTRLQCEVAQIVSWLSLLGLLLCALAVIAYGLTRGDWLQGLIAGIAMAMSMIPEEFPAVMTIFIAIAAWQMSRRHVLARRVAALEALSCVTTLCVDKTGTLTENRMHIRKLCTDHAEHQVDLETTLSEPFHTLLEFATLACSHGGQDPMDQAIRSYFERHLAASEHAHYDWIGVRDYALAPDLLATTQVWRDTRQGALIVAAKGAPEAIVDVCHLDAAVAQQVLTAAQRLSANGMRVLAVARATWQGSALPDHQHDFEYRYLGLLGFEDPLRPRVVESVRQCAGAGIRVIMITGDHPATASAVGDAIGLERSDRVVTGAELAELGAAARAERLASTSIFARVMPTQKLELVQELTARGEFVAMTGDGINDAPALRAAHVGIAMGRRGTDVARQAAAIVIADDDFSSIIAGFKSGRHVYDNLTKAARFIVAAHVPIAVVSLLPILLGWPLVLLPVHIAFLELLIDPTCSVVFAAEPADDDLMRRPPRAATARLVSARSAGVGILQGLIAATAVAAILGYAHWRHYPADSVRSLGFVTLVASSIALIFGNRELTHRPLHALTRRNPALWQVVGTAVGLLTLTQTVAPIRTLFQFGVATTADYALALAAASVAGLLVMLATRGYRRG